MLRSIATISMVMLLNGITGCDQNDSKFQFVDSRSGAKEVAVSTEFEMANAAEKANTAENEAPTFALRTFDITEINMEVTCQDRVFATQSLSFGLNVGDECQIKLLGFIMNAGQSYTLYEDFANFEVGSVAIFRNGLSSRFATVKIAQKLPSPIEAATTISFSVTEYLQRGTINATEGAEVAIESPQIQYSAYMDVESVRRLPNGKLRIEIRCSQTDVLGSSIAEATCYGDLITDMKFYFGLGCSCEIEGMQALIQQEGIYYSGENSRLETVPYGATVRQMVVLELDYDAAITSERLFITSLAELEGGDGAIRYHTVRLFP